MAKRANLSKVRVAGGIASVKVVNSRLLPLNETPACRSESELLLMIRLVTFIHQDLRYGKLVPSSHQRGKPMRTIFCTFNRVNDQI